MSTGGRTTTSGVCVCTFWADASVPGVRSGTDVLVAISITSSFSMYLDLAGLGRLPPLHADAQGAVGVPGIHALRIDVLRQRDDAAEVATEALMPVVGHVPLRLRLTAPRHAEHVLLQGDRQRLRIDAWREQIHVYLLGRGGDVDRRVRPA